MSLTCGNFAGKSRSYALVVLLTLATVQRADNFQKVWPQEQYALNA